MLTYDRQEVRTVERPDASVNDTRTKENRCNVELNVQT